MTQLMSSSPDGVVDNNHHQSQNTTLIDVKVQEQVIEFLKVKLAMHKQMT